MVVETLERKLADVEVPRFEVTEVRRTGRRRLGARIGGSVVAVLVAISAVSALAFGTGEQPDRAAVPDTLAPIYFGDGLRAVYNPNTRLVHLGTQIFPLGDVRDLETSASVTPFGLVFFGPDQSMRLLPEDGRVRTMLAGPARPDAFSPSVKYDAARGIVAWLTKGNDQVSLSVYEFGARPRLLGSYPVPCSGDECQSLSVAGVDQALVFVRGANGTRAIDPLIGQVAEWTPVIDGGVTDVRNRVILSDEGEVGQLPAGFVEEGWRIVAAQGPESQLTFDGGLELSTSTTLAPTAVGGVPVSLGIPPAEGEVFLNLDSDGSILVARAEADTDVFWDCQVTGECLELGRLEGAKGDPVFIGSDR